MATAAARVGELLGDLSQARKRPAEPSFETSPAKRRSGVKAVSSLDFVAFQDRVATFTSNLWCRSDCENGDGEVPLSPLQLARRGWAAVPGEERVVQCPSCREILSLVLPSVTSLVFKQFLAKQARRVENGHAEFCPWAASPCPEAWSRPQVDLVGWLGAAQSLCHLGQKLPYIVRSKLRPLDNLVSRVASKLGDDPTEVKEAAALLAILGWRDGASWEKTMDRMVPDTLVDIWGVRQIGLWTFRSLEEEGDRQESRRVASQLAGEEVEGEEEEDEDGKKPFDPVGEHLSWNPVRSKTAGGQGWLVLANEKTERVEKEPEKDVQQEPKAALQRVRHLLDQWC